MRYANKNEKRPQKCDRNAQEGGALAPRQGRNQKRRIVFGKMNKARIKLREKDESGDSIPH